MKRALLIAAVVGSALAQAPPTSKLFTYYAQPGDAAYSWKSVVVDAPLTFAVDASGQAHIGSAISTGTAAAYTFGRGLTTASSAGVSTQVFLDTAVVANRVDMPAHSGDCSAVGTGAWAANGQYFALCVQAGSGFTWRRVLLDTTAW